MRGALLVEVVVATAIATVAVFGLIALLANSIQLDGQTRARTRARRAVAGKLNTILAMDRPTFLTACTQTASTFLVFDIPTGQANEPRLVTPTGSTSLGNVFITPDPLTDVSGFQAASRFQVRVAAVWVSQTRSRVEVQDGVTLTAIFAPTDPPLESP